MAVANMPVETILVHPLFDAVSTGLLKIYGQDVYEVVLFGSMATGNANAESDIDILVILDRDTVRPIVELAKIGHLLAEVNVTFNELVAPVIVSRKDWESSKANPLFLEIRKYGLSVWKK